MNSCSIKVLLVDDEEEFVSTLSERLSLRGLSVITATRGDEALSILDQSDVQVAVIDFIMPGINGLEVLRHTKKSKPGVEVIILTGRGSTREGIEGMNLGAFDYLTKPIEIDRLVERIRSAADKQDTNEQNET